MKVIKIFVSIIGVLISMLLVVAAIAPSDYALNRDILIGKNKSEVFNYIKFLKNQANYSPWAKMDPDMKTDFQGTDGTTGFVSAWESENKQVGKGEQEIISIIDGERIETELRFNEPFEATDSAYIITESVSDSETKVTWGFVGHVSYPMNLLLLSMDMDKEIGVHLEHGLENLKKLLEI